MKVSVIIPSRNERFLQATVTDVLSKATGPVEVIVVLDGYWPDPPLEDDSRVVVLHKPTAEGLRPAINDAVRIATGDVLIKFDAHIMVEPGFDRILAESCEGDTVVVPRRVSLDPFTWTVATKGRAPVDYEFVAWPYEWQDKSIRMGNVWKSRARERIDIPVDEDMTFQGSCWAMRRDYFTRQIGPLQVEGYGHFILEPEEISNKAWLSGGRVLIDKRTTYAHWHKGKENGRGYFIDRRPLMKGRRFHALYWGRNEWPRRTRPFEWLIEHFWPVPHWPEDWRDPRHVEAYARQALAR